VNVVAAAGDYALRAAAAGINVSSGENYVATIELERLYIKLKGDNIDFDGGLMRLPFGYSTVWGSSDFLNPKNPLKPDARPLAILGGALSYFPVDDFKILGFATTGRDPFARNSGIAGIAADRHWAKASVQMLYALERSEIFSNKMDTSWIRRVGTTDSLWTHRVGASVKADIEVGFVMDMLYIYNQGIKHKKDGLSFSAGVDYSFLDARLITQIEYLYNGMHSSTSRFGGGNFANYNYLYTGAIWRFSDFTNWGIAVFTCFDDGSFVPLTSFNHDIFQGATLIVQAQIPMDPSLFSDNGNRGEFGRLPPGVSVGSSFLMAIKFRLRF
jgi:hypothetical protein